LQYYATMLGSAMAGMLARIPLHPIDTCKARLQVQTALGTEAVYRNFADALVKIGRTEGVAGLYRGFGVTLLGSAPAGVLYFTSYEVTKDTLATAPLLARVPALAHFAAGMVAEAFSCILWVPIDVIKERMQIQRRPGGPLADTTGPASARRDAPSSGTYYKNTADAVRQILRSEGVAGVYRGYGATIASFGPFSALYFVFYEQVRSDPVP
jgi:hypothetical protein